MPDRIIRSQNAFLSHALDSCPNLIFVKNDSFVITFANRSMLELYHPDRRSSVVGSTTAEAFSHEESELFFEADRQALAHGLSERIERIVDYTGAERTLSTKKTRFFDENGQRFILCVSTDITPLVQSEARLTRVNTALESYANEVAHDFASPLATLSMLSELIEQDPDSQLSPVALELIHNSVGIVSGLLTRVKALLTLCKAEGSRDLPKEWVSVEQICDQVTTALSAQLALTKGVVRCEQDAWVFCNPILLEVVIQNVVENSLKYRSQEPPVITICAEGGAGAQKLRISDNGSGVSQVSAHRLFEAGVQSEGSNPGAGLGLSICRKAVQLHDGSIWTEPGSNGGLAICFTLGFAPIEAQRARSVENG